MRESNPDGQVLSQSIMDTKKLVICQFSAAAVATVRYGCKETVYNAMHGRSFGISALSYYHVTTLVLQTVRRTFQIRRTLPKFLRKKCET